MNHDMNLNKTIKHNYTGGSDAFNLAIAHARTHARTQSYRKSHDIQRVYILYACQIACLRTCL